MPRQAVAAFFLCLLILVSVAAFDVNKCNACVNKGCGYCARRRQERGTLSHYESNKCTCDTFTFQFGRFCNDLDADEYESQEDDDDNNVNNNYGDMQENIYWQNYTDDVYNGQNETSDYNQYSGYARGKQDDDLAADDEPFERWVKTTKMKSEYQCYAYAQPRKTKLYEAVLAVVSLLLLIFTLQSCYYCQQMKKRKRQSPRDELLISYNLDA